MSLDPMISNVWLGVEFLIRLVALGTVPENRRPSSSSAWLLLIFLLPIVGLPLYLFLGSPWVHGRRFEQQVAANQATLEYTRDLPDVPPGAAPSAQLDAVLRMNRNLTGLPCVTSLRPPTPPWCGLSTPPSTTSTSSSTSSAGTT